MQEAGKDSSAFRVPPAVVEDMGQESRRIGDGSGTGDGGRKGGKGERNTNR